MSFVFLITFLIVASAATFTAAQSTELTETFYSNLSLTVEVNVTVNENFTSTAEATSISPPPLRHRTLTTSLSKSKSAYCGLFELFFGVPYFATGNISLKQAVAHQSFTLPLFMTLLARIENGIVVFDPDEFATTYFVDDPRTLVDSVEILSGSNVLSIPHIRRRLTWSRETMATWVMRPPADMLENIGISVQLKRDAFVCGVSWASEIPVGHVLLERRYSSSQVFFVRGMLTLGDIVAFVTAASSAAMVPHALQRSHVLALYFLCEIVDDTWYSVLESPFQMEVGPYHGSRPRGALIGNMLFVLAIAGGVAFLAVLVTFWRRKQTLHWSWKRCFRLPKPRGVVAHARLSLVTRLKVVLQNSVAFYCPKKSRTSVRLPGVVFIPFSFITLGTARASTELVRRALNPGDVILGVLGFLVLFAGFYWTCRKVLKRVRTQAVSWVVTIPDKEQAMETKCDRFCEFVRYSSFRFTTSSAAWFSRASAVEIKGGVGVTRTGARRRQAHDEDDDDEVHEDSDLDSDSSEGESSFGNGERDEEMVGENERENRCRGGDGGLNGDCESSTHFAGDDGRSQKSKNDNMSSSKNKQKQKSKKRQLRSSTRRDRNHNVRFASSGEGGFDSSIPSRRRFERKFVEKYGSVFDAFHPMGHFWGAVDLAVSFVCGLLTGLHPPLNSLGCSLTLLFLAVVLSAYLACLCLVRPWASLHNRFFGIAFATCNVAAIGINLFGSYTNDRALQDRADTLDLVTNGIALLKLFFDMVGLLLLPSLSGFCGYVSGSTSYQLMRQHAWTSEMARRERERDARDEEELKLWAVDADEDGGAEDEATTENDEDVAASQDQNKKDPEKKYRLVRKVRVIRRIVKAVPTDVTPVGSEKGDNDDDDDGDDDEQQEEQSRNLRNFYQPPPPSAASFSDYRGDDDDGDEKKHHGKRRGLTSLQRFMMI